MSEQSPLRKIIGHSTQIEYLDRLIDNDLVPHALLFSGPKGVGKRSVARSFAAKLLTGSEDNASREHSLKLIAAGNHPDLIFVNPDPEKQEIYVDDVRELCSKLMLKPYCSPYIIAIIDQAELMNLSACNALLKTLEEPPSASKIILTTSAAHRVPETIVSRCQPFFFGELEFEDLRELIADISLRLELSNHSQSTLLSMVQGAASSGTLNALNLKQLVDNRTLEFREPKRSKQHLEEISTRYTDLLKLFNNLISLEENAPSANYPVSLASEIAKDPTSSLVWRALHHTLRSKLLRVDKTNQSAWADLIEAAERTEKLIIDRNLNPQLQLTSFFLDVYRTAASS